MVSVGRGYFWERLPEEIMEEFAQEHPLVRAYDAVPYWEKHGWHIESALGDMSGIRKSEVRRRCESSTQAVKAIRATRKATGTCIACKRDRDPDSKNYCPIHREADRLRAAVKRERKAMIQANDKNEERLGLNMHFVITALDADTYETYTVDGYILTRENPDGSLYDFRVKMDKAGGAGTWTMRWSEEASESLVSGRQTLVDLCKKEMHQAYEPSGGTNIPGIPRCDSPTDLVCKWLLMKYAPAVWAEISSKVTPDDAQTAPPAPKGPPKAKEPR